MIYQGKARYPVHEAILHTPAFGDGWARRSPEDVLSALWRIHVKENGWRKIGYHRVVMPDGRILFDTTRLRSLQEIGAHVRERNRGTVGICMVNVRKHRGVTRFEDYFTDAQRSAVLDYLDELAGLTDLKWVTGHNDYAAKECPGFRVRQADWLPKRAA